MDEGKRKYRIIHINKELIRIIIHFFTVLKSGFHPMSKAIMFLLLCIFKFMSAFKIILCQIHILNKSWRNRLQHQHEGEKTLVSFYAYCVCMDSLYANTIMVYLPFICKLQHAYNLYSLCVFTFLVKHVNNSSHTNILFVLHLVCWNRL